MAAELIETARLNWTVDYNSPSFKVPYTVRGTEDPTEVDAIVLAGVPAFLLLPKVGVLFFHGYSSTRARSRQYEIEVNYGIKSQREAVPLGETPQGLAAGANPNGYGTSEADEATHELSFDTTGGTAHITQSKATVNLTAIDPVTGLENQLVAPDFDGAIGVNADQIDGCDIVVPKFTWRETYTTPRGSITKAYREILRNLTGKVNDAAFRSMARGEVLFEGASGTQKGWKFNITFQFAASANTSVPIPIGKIMKINKGGWEYLWVRYQEQANDTLGIRLRVPVAAYCEQVYDFGDFGQLGIGG